KIPSSSLLLSKQLPFHLYSTEVSQDGSTEPIAFETESRFKDKPWEYLESEEYIERYGSNPVWFGYRRNHKGPIPPQKTRKTCIMWDSKWVCMKKYKQLTKAIQQAQENGLLFFSIPFVNFQYDDFSNKHPAVTKTAPSPALQSKAAWYEWYEWQQPPEKEIKRIKRIYKDYLKEESGPP
ncbi:hypothetical protein JD844_013407, partial [Phrynosoma platyrhinos]